MKSSKPSTTHWWMIALATAIIFSIQLYLILLFPTSKAVWIATVGLIVFIIVLVRDPAYRYWRLACTCYGLAAASAVTPNVAAWARVGDDAGLIFQSNASPYFVTVFIVAGTFLIWLDYPQKKKAMNVRNPKNISITGNSNYVANGNITVNPAITDDQMQMILARFASESTWNMAPSEATAVNEELLWKTIETIKTARKTMEREEVISLVTELKKVFDRIGKNCSCDLQTEMLLLFAEEERIAIVSSKREGKKADLAYISELLKEIENVR